MKVLGIDPGATTGWCIYDTDLRAAVASGQFPDDEVAFGLGGMTVDAVVLERPKGQGPTRPQVVECGIVFGSLRRWAKAKWPRDQVHELLRLEVKQVLSRATHGEVHVKNDATAWAALRLLHGEGSDRKPRVRKGQVVDAGGAIGRVTSHERAALAVAVAWTLREGVEC